MRFTYDADADALTIILLPGEKIVRTVEFGEDRHVDLDASGRVVQIEILWPSSTGVKYDDIAAQFDIADYKSFLEDVAAAQGGFQPAMSFG